jgi:periplasmic protein TonB
MSYQALLFCPDEKTASVVTQVLSSLEFSVELCNEPFAAVKKLTTQHYDAVVVDCENEQNAGLLFKSARNSESNHSSLAVAVVEGQAGVAKAFRIGANLVLTKPINVDQAKGTLRVARGLLRKSEPGKAASPAKPVSQPPMAQPPSTQLPASSAKQVPPARPSASIPASKPVFKPSLTPKFTPPAAPAPVSAFSSPTVEDEPFSEASIDEDLAIEPAPEAAEPAAPSVKPAGKEYPWQPVSKPFAGPMASSLKRAAQAASGSDDPLQIEDTPAPAFRQPSTAQSQQVFSLSAAASAPARAKQPGSKIAEPNTAVQAEEKLKPAAIPTKLSITDPLAEEKVLVAEPSVPIEPPKLEVTKSGSSSKTGLIAVLVILALAAGGYFGWTKYHGQILHLLGKTPSATAAVSATPTASSPQAPTMSTPAAEPKSSNAIAVTDNSAPAKPEEINPEDSAAKPQPEKITVTKPKAAESNDEDESAEQAPSEPAPILVKKGGARPAPSQPQVQAPPDTLMAASGGEKALSGIVGSVPARVPKEALQELRVSQGVMQAMVVKKVEPQYPLQAEHMRVQGTVQLAVNIAKDGTVTNVTQISGDHLLGRAAIDAVSKWKYKPYLVGNQAVRVKTQVTIDFRLP